MRKIAEGYGKKILIRVDCYISLFLIVYFIELIFAALTIFKISKFYDTIGFIFFLSEFIVIMVMVLLQIHRGVVINSYFKIHKKCLKQNKDKISYLLYLDNIKEALDINIKMESELINIYKEFNHDEGKIINQIEKIIMVYEDILEDLDIQSEIEPFKVMGLNATQNLLNSILTTIASISFAVVQKVLNIF